jgi:hypothetical protein
MEQPTVKGVTLMATSYGPKSDRIGDKHKDPVRAKAILTYSALAGAIALAHAVSGETLSREILKSVSRASQREMQLVTLFDRT